MVFIAAVWSYVLSTNYLNYEWNKDGVFNLVVFRPTMILLGCVVALNKDVLIRLVLRTRFLFMTLFFLCLYSCITLQFPGFAAIGTASAILLLSPEVVEKSVAMRGIRAVLAFGPLAWLGILSYSIYIWHMPVILYLTSNWSHGLPSHWVLVGWLLGAAVVSFYVIEAPVHKKWVCSLLAGNL